MGNFFWGLVCITLGVLFLLDNLGYADFHDVIKNYLPLILIFWGLSMLVRKRQVHAIDTSQKISPFLSDLLHQSNVFGDIHVKISSQNFKGGSLSTVFGDCNVDLSDSTLADGDHELRIHSVFGDSKIIIPKDTSISVTATSTFGDLNILGKQKGGFSPEIHFTSPTYSTATKRLKLSISKVFGDIRIE